MRKRSLAETAAARGVRDARVLEAMRAVDRRDFVPAHLVDEAGRDEPLPIGDGQTTSQPSLIAQMLEAAEIGPHDRVLEVGTGFGYQTALLCHLAGEVVSIERHARLAEAARANLAAAGCEARVEVGDGHEGVPDAAPYDAIVVSAATSAIPDAWVASLVEDGRLVVPVGGRGGQVVEVWRARGGRLVDRRTLVPVRFVPLVRDDQSRSRGVT
ncbi:MAG: protein-L-isoaspartate(D-aspartate) O-methyltransferase [Actinomycetota bacterium]